MAGTKRIPIHRPARHVVTERTVNLFKLALTYPDQDLHDRAFYTIDRGLHRELGLAPWHESVLDITVDSELPPHVKDQLSIDRWYYVRDLRRTLVSAT